MSLTDSRRHDPGGFVPAAGRGVFTSLYDGVMRLTVREKKVRAAQLAQIEAALPDDGSLIDIGSGTGTLAIAVAQARPDATVTGIDLDRDVIAIARGKAGSHGVDWKYGGATALPVKDAAADVAVISLVLHHLQPDEQRDALAQAHRTVKPGGTLLVTDWGRPHDPLMWTTFSFVRLLDGRSNTAPHARGELPGMIAAAGFTQPARIDAWRTLWGQLELLVSRRPD